MKKMLLIAVLFILSTSLTACTYWTNNKDGFDMLDSDLDESVFYEKDLSSYEQVEINIDLTVSGVKVETIGGDTLKFEQKANREELLAAFDFSDSGDKAILTFKNDHGIKLTAGTQNSETLIQIPDGVKVVFISNLDVGDFEMDMDDVEMLEVDASTNVGKISLSASEDQDLLNYINASSDVGDIALTFDGALEKLEEVNMSTNTGEIEAAFNGELSNELKLESKTDVGDITLDFGGVFKEKVTCKAESSVGDINLLIPEDHEVILDAHLTEFTTNLEISDIPFSKSKSIYKIDGDEALFNIDLSVSVGDATVKYSN